MIDTNILLQNRYLVLRPIGRGGMGAVYEATDTRLHARVALKETLLNDSASRRAFEREAKLLARLRHPALPKVIDHFTEEAGQFLVMEFIAGDDLAALMEKRGGQFPMAKVVPWALRWADQLLDALDYLHTQTPPVIHRDIKPQNLKLSSRGDIILLDFGLAKGGMTDMSTVTAQGGKLLGFTPNYAPLEQFRGSDPDPRSDLYSLGATMYHLITGQKPPDALTRIAALLNEQHDPLRPASKLNPHVPQQVAAVINHALAPNIEDRFATAAEMRRVLQAAQTNNQVRSTVPTGASTSDVSIFGSTSVTQAGQGQGSRTEVNTADTSDSSTRRLLPNSPADPVVGTLLQTFLTGSPVICIALSPDGTKLAAGSDDHSIGVWDIQEANLRYTLQEHTRGVSSVAFSPDGDILASGSEDKTVCLWRVSDGALLYQSEEHSDPIESVVFSPDGKWLAVGGWGDAVVLCHIEDNQVVDTVDLTTSFIHSLAFSPDGKLLAAGCYDTTIRLWRVQDRLPKDVLEGLNNFVLTVAFDPSGKNLAAGGGESDIRVWRVSDGRMLDVLHGHTNFVRSLVYSPDGNILASGSEDRTVRIWRTSDGSCLHTFEGHGDGVTCVFFCDAGRVLVSGSRDTKIRFWQAQTT